jgi:hypothetical protein
LESDPLESSRFRIDIQEMAQNKANCKLVNQICAAGQAAIRGQLLDEADKKLQEAELQIAQVPQDYFEYKAVRNLVDKLKKDIGTRRGLAAVSSSGSFFVSIPFIVSFVCQH